MGDAAEDALVAAALLGSSSSILEDAEADGLVGRSRGFVAGNAADPTLSGVGNAVAAGEALLVVAVEGVATTAGVPVRGEEHVDGPVVLAVVVEDFPRRLAEGPADGPPTGGEKLALPALVLVGQAAESGDGGAGRDPQLATGALVKGKVQLVLPVLRVGPVGAEDVRDTN